PGAAEAHAGPESARGLVEGTTPSIAAAAAPSGFESACDTTAPIPPAPTAAAHSDARTAPRDRHSELRPLAVLLVSIASMMPHRVPPGREPEPTPRPGVR